MNEKMFFVQRDKYMFTVMQQVPSSRPAAVASFAHEAQAVGLSSTLNNLHDAATAAATMLRRRLSQLQSCAQVLDNITATVHPHEDGSFVVADALGFARALCEAIEFRVALHNTLTHANRDRIVG